MNELDYEEYTMDRAWAAYHARMKKTEVKTDDGYAGIDGNDRAKFCDYR